MKNLNALGAALLGLALLTGACAPVQPPRDPNQVLRGKLSAENLTAELVDGVWNWMCQGGSPAMSIKFFPDGRMWYDEDNQGFEVENFRHKDGRWEFDGDRRLTLQFKDGRLIDVFDLESRVFRSLAGRPDSSWGCPAVYIYKVD